MPTPPDWGSWRPPSRGPRGPSSPIAGQRPYAGSTPDNPINQFTEDYEGTNGAAISGAVGTVTLDNTRVVHGSTALRATLSASTASYLETVVNGTGTDFIRVYVPAGQSFPPVAGVNVRLVRALTSAGLIAWELRINSAGQFDVMVDAAGTLIQEAIITPPDNTHDWRLEAKITEGANNIELRLFDGDSTTATTVAQGSANIPPVAVINRVRRGALVNNPATGDVWLDDFGWSNIDWLGPSGTATTPIVATDTATLTDASAGQALSGSTETGTLTDASAGIALASTDTATLSESAGPPGAFDTASLSESVTVLQLLTGTDSLSLSAESAALTATVAATESATLTEGASAAPATLTSTDSATLSELATAAQLVAAGDSAVLSEDVTDLVITDAAADITLAGESASVDTGSTTPSGTDTATLSEARTATAAGAATDTATLSEGGSAIVVTVSSTEALSLLEAAAISAAVAGTDTATLSELAFPTLPFTATNTLTFVETSAVVAPFIPPTPSLGALDDLIWAWFTSRETGPSAADAMYRYFRLRSGLPANRGLADHMVAYYAAALGVPNPEDVPLTTLEIAFWQAVDPTNNTGSWAVRAQRFYGA